MGCVNTCGTATAAAGRGDVLEQRVEQNKKTVYD
jgi:hypothetical protein